MSTTALQIEKPKPVSQNKNHVNSIVVQSPQTSLFPGNVIRRKANDGFEWMNDNKDIQQRKEGYHAQSSKQLIIQPKLEISQPGDSSEREADEMANKVMSVSESVVPGNTLNAENMQSSHVSGTISLFKEPIVNETSGSISEEIIGNSGNSGNHLPGETRSFMESRFNADFGNVKIHTDSNAVQMNSMLNAQAFTHGDDIYFNNGKYNPESSSGKHLLAHELTHVVQQNGKVQRKAVVYNDVSTEKSDIVTALDVAAKMTDKAQIHIGGDKRDRYKRWFDTNYDPANPTSVTRFNQVKKGWVKMHSVFKSKDVEFNCATRNQAIFAQVNTGDKHYLIELGKSFWKAALTGRDSRGGTIVHEISHEEVYTNSTFNDFYGAATAQKLAKDDPDKAVKNADNWEFFAEDSY